ncbi:hypothetical protein Mapa_014740 [Marchantia paleacea]|nr:hypothetical protein Mapa_014740 [Marchantia paleacea]
MLSIMLWMAFGFRVIAAAWSAPAWLPSFLPPFQDQHPRSCCDVVMINQQQLEPLLAGLPSEFNACSTYFCQSYR